MHHQVLAVTLVNPVIKSKYLMELFVFHFPEGAGSKRLPALRTAVHTEVQARLNGICKVMLQLSD